MDGVRNSQVRTQAKNQNKLELRENKKPNGFEIRLLRK